ncbi:hypothetical protein EON64_02720 [archaeon]|nr:MAG: hypothetical protein EON64_02720 [archaeon]
MDPQSLIAGYSKHTPKLLRQQILCELLKQYLTTPAPAGSHGETPLVKCMPSVQRFHGAMLFVDISGFTALSLRLDVETLKNHINMYFSKMLDIVEKWDGDVIKFAGDALFIIWPTAPLPASSHTDNDSISRLSARNSMDSKHFTQAARRALEKAVACGLEISAECGNYEVKLTDSSSTSPSKTEASSGGGGLVNKFLKLGSFLSGSRVSPGNDDVAYLDVHSGVSCGLMAGIDVVHGTRGEFFLVGEPLIGVAMAESQAMKGDVVLDTTAHDVLHGTKTNFSEEEGEEVMLQSPQFKQMGSGQQAADLPCGCVCTPSGLFVVKKLITRVSKGGLERRKTRSQLKVELIQQRSEHHSLSLKTYEDVVQDVEELFLTARPSMRKAFYQYLKNSDVGGKYSEFTFLEFMQNHIKKHFEENMHGALLEYATLHVHEVERRGALSGSTQKRRNSSFHDIMDSSRHLLTNFTTISKLIDSVNTTVAQHSPVNTQSSTAQAEHNARIKNKDSELDDASKLAERNKRRHRASISSFAAEVNNGEIRTIIVMFVKIERFDLHLKVDNFSKVAYSNRFVFLDRTESELEADDTLLNRLQACFAVLCDAFHEHGGQLRQFIVDDKGTVCIGTFGLRGSTAVDNAASAMEASKYIIDNMKRVDLHAHIGITSGKAYCGLVGSSVRHEYAVMGPSTNLAARLMCKARLNSVICDADTADRDRTHKFDALQEIQAKGYSQPVMIYRPMFNHREESFTMRNFRFLSSRNMAAVGTKKKKKRSLKAVVAMVTYTRMLSAKSLVPKQSFTERMLALCTTDFYQDKARSSGQ